MKGNGEFAYWFASHIKKPVIEVLYRFCNSLCGMFAQWAEHLERHAAGPAIHYTRPTKSEREEGYKHLRIGLAIVLAVIVLTVLISWFAKYLYTVQASNITLDEWNSSAGSFWGAVLGAAVTGIATVTTTVLVIQRSYKIDYHRERLEVLPVLDMQVFLNHYVVDENAETELRDREPNIPHNVVIAFGSCSLGEEACVYTIKNIGKGIAYDIRTAGFYTEDFEEARRCGVLPPADSFLLVASPKHDGTVTLMFFDLHENQYRQVFELYEQHGQVAVTTRPPELIRKTNRIRYTQ